MKIRAGKSSSRRGHVRGRASRPGKGGFTLIEMIGVMAVMAILAAVLVPNALKSIDRAAIRAEAETLRNLGEHSKLYLRDYASAPLVANWNTSVGSYASLSPAEVLTNKRQMTRVYVLEPVTAPAIPQRALIVSSMRTGVAPQSAAYIGANATRFNDVWNWNTSSTPFAAPAGWGAWNAANVEYLVIERINFSPVYRTDLQAYAVSLRNLSGGSVSYRITRANGTVAAAVTLAAGTSTTVTPLYPRDQLSLYRAAGAVNLDFTYVVSTTGKTFEFSSTNWIAQ